MVMMDLGNAPLPFYNRVKTILNLDYCSVKFDIFIPDKPVCFVKRGIKKTLYILIIVNLYGSSF